MHGNVDGAEDVHDAAHNVEGSRGDVRDEGRCVATWTAPRMCAAPRTMGGRCGATWGTKEMSAATWTVDDEPTAFGRCAARVQREDYLERKLTLWSQG
jgi:hypothetical protein